MSTVAKKEIAELGSSSFRIFLGISFLILIILLFVIGIYASIAAANLTANPYYDAPDAILQQCHTWMTIVAVLNILAAVVFIIIAIFLVRRIYYSDTSTNTYIVSLIIMFVYFIVMVISLLLTNFAYTTAPTSSNYNISPPTTDAPGNSMDRNSYSEMRTVFWLSLISAIIIVVIFTVIICKWRFGSVPSDEVLKAKKEEFDRKIQDLDEAKKLAKASCANIEEEKAKIQELQNKVGESIEKYAQSKDKTVLAPLLIAEYNRGLNAGEKKCKVEEAKRATELAASQARLLKELKDQKEISKQFVGQKQEKNQQQNKKEKYVAVKVNAEE